MINPHTGREFTQDFFRNYARGKRCMIRIAPMYGLRCAHRDTTVLCHITMAGLSVMGGKPPDLLGAWGCSTCHDLVDRRMKLPYSVEGDQLERWHMEGMARTIDQLIIDGVLPNR